MRETNTTLRTLIEKSRSQVDESPRLETSAWLRVRRLESSTCCYGYDMYNASQHPVLLVPTLR